MGIFGNVDVSGVAGGVTFSGLGKTVLIIVIAFVIFVAVGGLTFYRYVKKAKKTAYKIQIPIFIRFPGGRLEHQGVEYAKEVFIPNTNISFYLLKFKKTYLARGTRFMGLNEVWYCIGDNGEWINFDLSFLPGTDSFVVANYDHRDTRYAFVNAQEIIKRNYQDKSTTWWKDPTIINIIAFVIMSFVFAGVMIIVLSRTGKLIQGLVPVSENFKESARMMAEAVKTAQNLNSGVVPG